MSPMRGSSPPSRPPLSASKSTSSRVNSPLTPSRGGSYSLGKTRPTRRGRLKPPNHCRRGPGLVLPITLPMRSTPLRRASSTGERRGTHTPTKGSTFTRRKPMAPLCWWELLPTASLLAAAATTAATMATAATSTYTDREAW